MLRVLQSIFLLLLCLFSFKVSNSCSRSDSLELSSPRSGFRTYTMPTNRNQDRPSKTVDEFLAKHPEVELGRAALDKFQTDIDNTDTFSIVKRPFSNMVLHQEFDADTKERVYVVALIDDQEALDYYAEMSEETAQEDKCDCAKHQGPDHLIFDRMVEIKKDCPTHMGAKEPDPDCSDCWPILCGGNCEP
jgi:hypothetical protein